MTVNDYSPLYQHEDELVTVRLGKPGTKSGAFLGFNGNIQLGFMDNQYTDTFMPILKSIVNESTEGKYKFYESENGEYRLQHGALMVIMNNATALSLKHHAKKALTAYIPYSNMEYV